MANKRDLKKFIRNTCGALALDMILARESFPQIDRKAVHDVVVDAARLQGKTLRRVNFSYDLAPESFEDYTTYKKARAAYYRKAYATLLNDFNEEIGAIVKQMNAALPDEVRKSIKEAIS